jgi:hypothetical protein
VEPPASPREPPVRGERAPQRGSAPCRLRPCLGSWGCWAVRAAPRAGRRPGIRPGGPVGPDDCSPRRGTRPARRRPRAPAGAAGRAARAFGGPSAETGARPGTPRSDRRPRVRRDAPATADRAPGWERRPGPRAVGPRTVLPRAGPWARVARSAVARCGRHRNAGRPGGRRRAALGRGCPPEMRPRGRGNRSARPGCCRCRARPCSLRARAPTGRRSCAPRCPYGPSRCSCRLLPHVMSAAGEGAADKEKGRQRRRIRRSPGTGSGKRVTEPLWSHSGPVGDPFLTPRTCRQEVRSERGNGRGGRRSSGRQSDARGVSNGRRILSLSTLARSGRASGGGQGILVACPSPW